MLTFSMNNMLQLINMTFTNNVSHESGKNYSLNSTLQFNSILQFPFYTKIKTSILLHLPRVR